MKPKIGILGSGVVAQSLGSGFLKHGYEVMLGTRDQLKLAEWQASGNGKTGNFSDAASYGDIIVLAVKGSVAVSALEMAGRENLAGKVVIDTTNPIADAAPVNGVLQFYTNLNESQMERLQSGFQEVHFVKAFSCVGSHLMVNPDLSGGKPSMFICSNNADAKKEVAVILDLFGWETEDMGAAEAARAIEPLCMLWCIPGFLRNEWVHAFKLLKG